MIVGLNCTKRITMKGKKTRRTGLIVAQDDLTIGEYYSVLV